MNANNTNEQFVQRFSNARRSKRCHGNRRNQRFRKRCRARKMKPATIMKLLEKRNRTKTTINTNNTETNKNNMETTAFATVSTGIHSSEKNQLTTNFCKQIELQLWQLYLDIGLQHQIRPVSVF
ncbi:unnamed protein product [Rotaria sordida]|uniref:Uncharacterized protein n=1 Tax=Rotaria sordida TaxID=392033 RepID=A0A815PU49_9BILA|nr:unnamed protein product [Rotaria sordida]CAF1529099.1 unnamed protein product [Rotaria sordida]